MRSTCLLTVTIAGFAGQCFGQLPGWGGPVSGLVFDPPTKSLRRIAGFPGAAQLSTPILENIEWSAPSPDGRRSIARTVSGETIWAEGIEQESPTLTTLAADLGPAVIAKWRRDSSAVRIYEPGCACFLTYNARKFGMPELTGASAPLDPSLRQISDFVWSDSTTIVAAAGGLYGFDGTHPATAIAALGDGVRYFLEQDGGMWAVRPSSGQILELHARSEAEAAMSIVAEDAARFGDVTAIASAPSGLWVADRSTSRIYRLDRDSGAVSAALHVETSPSSLTRLNDRSLWHLGDRLDLDRPLLVLDGAGTPQVFFVPGGDQR